MRNLDGNWAFVPAPLPPTLVWTNELVSTVSAADRALGRLAGDGGEVANPLLLLRSFLRREAALSSRIEGTRADLSDMVLFEESPSQEERAPDVREADNNYRALTFGLESVRHRPVSSSLIREMHAMLMDGVRGGDKTPGRFRGVQNFIGPTNRIEDARFVPPPPLEVNPAMDALERYLQLPSDLPPLVRLAMVHYQFEAMHPFQDGNGRIGRVIIVLLLCTEKVLSMPLLNPSAFLERNRDEYYDRLLNVSLRGEWAQWVTFFARGMAAEAMDAVDRIGRLRRLRAQYHDTVRGPRASALLLRLIDELFGTPAITTARAAGLLGVKPTSAQKNIDRLVKAGIVHEVTGYKRNRIYLAEGIVRAIDEPAT